MDINRQLLDVDNINPQYEPLLLALELNGVSTVDLLIHQASDTLLQLLKKVGRSIREIEDFITSIESLLGQNAKPKKLRGVQKNAKISTGLKELDNQLQGGISLGEITEVFGASGCGKSQFMYQLAGQSLISSDDRVVIINTEKFLETKRLLDIVSKGSDPKSPEVDKKLTNIDYYYCRDLETQDHILYSQLPLKLKSNSNIKVIIIDSIGHHLRHDEIDSDIGFLKSKIQEQYQDQYLNSVDSFESDKLQQTQQYNTFFRSNRYYEVSVNRKNHLLATYRHLKSLCDRFNVAVVVSNQVSDQLNNFDPLRHLTSNDPLDLDYQIGSISGWDNRAILDYQKQFSSVPYMNEPHISGGDEIEFNKELSNVLNMNKRPNTGTQEGEVDSQPTNNTYHMIDELVSKFHRTKNLQTKQHVASLGYHWTKLLANRILLAKTYRPVVNSTIDYDEFLKSQSHFTESSNTSYNKTNDVDGHYSDHNSDSEISGTSHHNVRKRHYPQESVPIHSFIGSWNVDRYLQLITNQHATIPKIKFTLNKSGLH